MVEWRCSSTILDLSTVWKWVVSFTLRPLYPQGKIPHYPLNRRLGGPQSRSGHCWEERYLLPLLGIEPQPSNLKPVTILTEPFPVGKLQNNTTTTSFPFSCYFLSITVDAVSLNNTKTHQEVMSIMALRAIQFSLKSVQTSHGGKVIRAQSWPAHNTVMVGLSVWKFLL
jgi:hypothetical protein